MHLRILKVYRLPLGMCRKSKLRVYIELKEDFECKESLTWVLNFCSDLYLEPMPWSNK